MPVLLSAILAESAIGIVLKSASTENNQIMDISYTLVQGLKVYVEGYLDTRYPDWRARRWGELTFDAEARSISEMFNSL